MTWACFWLISAAHLATWAALFVRHWRRAFRLGKAVGYADGYADGVAWSSESWSHFVRVHLGIKAPDRESAN